MGYLNNSTITVDAILTTKGRQLLSAGQQYFNITQFALADDEVDYTLWNPAHQLGSNYYGEVIENMPVLEAVPDEGTECMYKLVTLKKDTQFIPVVKVNGSTTPSVTFVSNGESQDILPQTTNITNGNSTFGYTAILSDASVCSLNINKGLPGGVSVPTTPSFIGDAGTQSISKVGMSFTLIAKQSPVQDLTATLIIIANETGGRSTVTITINKPQAPIPTS
jgi:hypothetical protein